MLSCTNLSRSAMTLQIKRHYYFIQQLVILIRYQLTSKRECQKTYQQHHCDERSKKAI
jgi:hypothetical protein